MKKKTILRKSILSPDSEKVLQNSKTFFLCSNPVITNIHNQMSHDLCCDTGWPNTQLVLGWAHVAAVTPVIRTTP